MGDACRMRLASQENEILGFRELCSSHHPRLPLAGGILGRYPLELPNQGLPQPSIPSPVNPSRSQPSGTDPAQPHPGPFPKLPSLIGGKSSALGGGRFWGRAAEAGCRLLPLCSKFLCFGSPGVYSAPASEKKRALVLCSREGEEEEERGEGGTAARFLRPPSHPIFMLIPVPGPGPQLGEAEAGQDAWESGSHLCGARSSGAQRFHLGSRRLHPGAAALGCGRAMQP